MTRTRLQDLILGAVGIALFLGAWEVIGANGWAGLTWPRFSTVMAYLTDPARAPLFRRAMAASFSMAALGYLLGFALGFLAAMLVYIARPLRPGIDRFAGTINAIPGIALAPIFIVLMDRDFTGMAIAAINVFFVIYVATTSGLEKSRQNHRDLFQVIGASPLSRFYRLDLPAALPSIVSGMKYATPAAFIGTILGEWFGATRGLGLLMVSAMQNFQIPLLWSAVVITSTASLLAFGLLSLVERFVHARFA
jgi:ABC-type nitrate/sulfonate/bicarbonate transport system permease component